MKKIFRIIAILSVLLFASAAFAACTDATDERDPMVNYYNGSGETFSFAIWHSGVAGDVFEVDEEVENETFVSYRKSINDTYAQLQSKVSGRLSDFSYVNFEMKASKNIMMMAQLNFFDGYEDNDGNPTKESLVGELVFDVDTTVQTFTFRIYESKKLMLDLLEDVWLFPEPGMGGADYSGSFILYDCYFSKEKPEACVFVNESGNGSDDVVEQKVGSWRNESTWTGYKMYPNTNGEVDISFTGAAQWATISRILTDFDLTHNTLDFSFDNKGMGMTEPDYSISQICFRLRGDKKRLINDPKGYSYWEYYEADVGTYKLDADAQDAKESDNHRVDLSFDIVSARNTIRKHITNGIRLVMLIESHPDYRWEDGNVSNFNGSGNMSVVSVETYRDDTKPDIINNSDFIGDTCYTLSSVDGETLGIAYDTTIQHANIFHEFEAATTAPKSYSFTLKNEGGADVEVRYCAKKGGVDGNIVTVTLAVGETMTYAVELSTGVTAVALYFDSGETTYGAHLNSRLTLTNYGITD